MMYVNQSIVLSHGKHDHDHVIIMAWLAAYSPGSDVSLEIAAEPLGDARTFCHINAMLVLHAGQAVFI